jgi:hypothetical protein
MSTEELLNAFEEALSAMPQEWRVSFFNAVGVYQYALTNTMLAGKVPSELPSDEYHKGRLLEARARLLPLLDDLLGQTDEARAAVWHSKLAGLLAGM